MIFIRKGAAPPSLTEYRTQQYAVYDGANKEDIRAALLQEQGYLCAYCMRRIKNDSDTMKIEHWKPQSTLTEAEKLDYRMMLGVCDGCRGSSPANTTCDTHRGNADLTINPQDIHMMNTVYYTKDGLIHSDDSTLDRDLDKTLNLNCRTAASRLVLNRKHVYEEVEERLKRLQPRGLWNETVLQKIEKQYASTDSMLPEYIGVVRYVLQKHRAKCKS